MPLSCIVTALTWGIEAKACQAQSTQPDPGNGPPDCLFVPDSVCSQVLQWAHSSYLTCHPEGHRTFSYLKRHTKPCSGLLSPLPIPSRPCTHVALDFVTGLPPPARNTTVLSLIVSLRLPILLPCPNFPRHVRHCVQGSTIYLSGFQGFLSDRWGATAS